MNAAHITLGWKHKSPPVKWPEKTTIAASSIFLKFVIIIMACAIMFLGYLAERAVLSQNESRIHRSKQELRVLEEEYQNLLINTARLKSPERIEKVAIEQLGMVVPSHISYIQLPSDYSLKSTENVEIKVSPVTLADDFWLAKVFRATDKTIKRSVSPGTAAEAHTN